MVITTAQPHSTKPEHRFCAGSNPAGSVSEILDGEDLCQWSRLQIRLNAFSSVNHTTKTTHHHHHQLSFIALLSTTISSIGASIIQSFKILKSHKIRYSFFWKVASDLSSYLSNALSSPYFS